MEEDCFLAGDLHLTFLRELQREGVIVYGKLEGLRENINFCRDSPLLGRSCVEGPHSSVSWLSRPQLLSFARGLLFPGRERRVFEWSSCGR